MAETVEPAPVALEEAKEEQDDSPVDQGSDATDQPEKKAKTEPSGKKGKKTSAGAKAPKAEKAQKPKISKPKAAKKPSNHPTYAEMIKAAVSSLKERGGSSRQAILKYIMMNYNVGSDEKKVNSHLKMALRAGVKNSSLKQSKGTGASGSFRMGAVKKAKAKSKPKKARKPKAAAKPKKVKKPKKSKKTKVEKKLSKPKTAKASKVKKSAGGAKKKAAKKTKSKASKKAAPAEA